MATITSGRVGSMRILGNAASNAYTTPALTMSAIVANKLYRLPYAQGDKRFIDSNIVATVKYDAVAKTKGTDYVFSGPTLVNISGLSPTAVTIEGYSYYDTIAYGDASEWNLSVNFDTEEATMFGNSGWKTSVGMFSGAEVTVSKYNIDNDLLQNHLDSVFALVLQVDSTGPKRFECYGRLSKESMKVAANGLLQEDLTFEVQGRVVYLSS